MVVCAWLPVNSATQRAARDAWKSIMSLKRTGFAGLKLYDNIALEPQPSAHLQFSHLAKTTVFQHMRTLNKQQFPLDLRTRPW